MKKLLLAIGLFLAPTASWAQCNGVFPAHTLCGNNTAAVGIPSQFPASALTSLVGGTSGQIQYNNAGVFGGFTASGDATITPSTGAVVVSKFNGGTVFGTAAAINIGTSLGTLGLLNANKTDSGANTYSGNNIFSGTDVFNGGIAVGTGAAAPATADIYNYNATRSVLWQSQRDQVLSSGSPIGDTTYRGQNASAGTVTWADNFAAPPFCRGRPSISGFACATGTLTAGTEEGAFYIGTKSSNTITLATSATTAIGNPTLTFASSVQDSGNLIGKTVTNATHPTSIPAGTFVIQETSTTVVLSQNVASPGVSIADSISFTSNDLIWSDSDGLFIGGQRNIFVPAGQGYVSFDSSGTATYNVSFNSHANNSLDFQSCNNIGITCAGLGAVPAMRFYTSAAGAGQPIIALNYDLTVTLQFANGTASSTKAVCMDSSNRLVKSATGTCP